LFVQQPVDSDYVAECCVGCVTFWYLLAENANFACFTITRSVNVDIGRNFNASKIHAGKEVREQINLWLN